MNEEFDNPMIVPSAPPIEEMRPTEEITNKNDSTSVARSVGQAVESVARPVGKAVESVARPVGQAVESVARPVGKAVESVARPVGKAVEYTTRPVRNAVASVARPVARGTRRLVNKVSNKITGKNIFDEDVEKLKKEEGAQQQTPKTPGFVKHGTYSNIPGLNPTLGLAFIAFTKAAQLVMNSMLNMNGGVDADFPNLITQFVSSSENLANLITKDPDNLAVKLAKLAEVYAYTVNTVADAAEVPVKNATEKISNMVTDMMVKLINTAVTVVNSGISAIPFIGSFWSMVIAANKVFQLFADTAGNAADITGAITNARNSFRRSLPPGVTLSGMLQGISNAKREFSAALSGEVKPEIDVSNQQENESFEDYIRRVKGLRIGQLENELATLKKETIGIATETDATEAKTTGGGLRVNGGGVNDLKRLRKLRNKTRRRIYDTLTVIN